jgi:hypothetical protein
VFGVEGRGCVSACCEGTSSCTLTLKTHAQSQPRDESRAHMYINVYVTHASGRADGCVSARAHTHKHTNRLSGDKENRHTNLPGDTPPLPRDKGIPPTCLETKHILSLLSLSLCVCLSVCLSLPASLPACLPPPLSLPCLEIQQT